MIPILLLLSIPLCTAQPLPAWDLRVDHQLGDSVPWNDAVYGDVYTSIRVVSGVSVRGRVLFSWKLPRDLERGCMSLGFNVEVTHDSDVVSQCGAVLCC